MLQILRRQAGIIDFRNSVGDRIRQAMFVFGNTLQIPAIPRAAHGLRSHADPAIQLLAAGGRVEVEVPETNLVSWGSSIAAGCHRYS